MIRSKVKINVRQANQILNELSATERIKWITSKISEGVVATTSGGKTSRILPSIIKDALGKTIPTIFIDTGFYPEETYQFLDQMQKDGIDIKYYNPKMSIKRIKALYGNLWEAKKEKFDQFLEIVKHEPLNRAFKQLKAHLWIRGIMGFQTKERQRMPIFEYKNGIYRLYPIVDWPRGKAEQHLQEKNLPVNLNHHDLTKGSCGKKECKIGERTGFVGGGGI